MSTKQKNAFVDKKMVSRAIQDSFVKCDPKIQVKNPVMFIVYVAAVLTTESADLNSAASPPTLFRLPRKPE